MGNLTGPGAGMAALADTGDTVLGDEVSSVLGGLSTTMGVVVVAAAVAALYLVTRMLVLRVMAPVARRTETAWDDRFVQRRAPHRLALVPPALLAYVAVSAIEGLPGVAVVAVQRAAQGVVVLAVAWASFAILDVVNDIYEGHDYAASRPIKGYLQLVKLLLAIVAIMLVIAVASGRSPLLLLSGLGAATAILLLIFRDTILSLVASVQLATNDMVRVGDWITIDSLGVDGDVVDLALHTATIRNFDMSFAFVPTHKLIEEPFSNWRGMRDVKARRIMRQLHVDVGSVRFLTDEDLAAFARWPLLAQHLGEALDDIGLTDQEHDAAAVAARDERRLTNLGVFRAYTLQWLRNHDDLHVDNGFPMMVRLLEPTPSGQPVEIYCFSRITDWVAFEEVQADIFDHLHAILPAFHLRPYQYPGGHDLEPLRNSLRPSVQEPRNGVR